MLLARVKGWPRSLQAAVGAVLAVVVFCGAVAWLCAPLWAERAAVLARYQQEKARLDKIERFVLAHPEGEAYVQEVAAQAALTDTLLPDTPAWPAFMTMLAQEAQKDGVRLVEIKPQSPQPQPAGYTALPVDITVEGDYYAVLTFLQGLQDLPRYTTISRLDIRAPRPVNPRLEGKIRVEIYQAGQASAVGQAGQPAAAPPRPPTPPPMPPPPQR